MDTRGRDPVDDGLDDPVESMWRARLRWRLAGATMWPAFAALTGLEAVAMHLRPIAGDAITVPAAFVLCGFMNLAVVAIGAPIAGRALRVRRPSLPKEVAADRAGTGLLLAMAAVILAVGLAHHGDVVAEERDFAAQSAAVRQYVRAQAPPAYRVNIDRADTWKQAPDLYRTCVPGPDPRKHLCLIVSTAQHPPGITVDADQQPNARVAGPENPGRIGG